MDIDDFLDRELSDIGLDTDKAEKNANAFEAPEFSGQLESSPLFENIKASLSKGNLEQAEQAYVQMWHILTQQKLKWDKELHGQLLILTRQFSSALNYLYNEVKKKAAQISDLIAKARASLREGKKELPFRIYAEIQEINSSIPSVFFEEKRIVQEQIMDFYKELSNTTDNELVKRVSILIQEINKVIERMNSSIRANDMVNAIVDYNKAIELYNQVPEGFLRYKNSIGMRILDAYKILSIYNEISGLQKQLAQQPPNQTLRFQQNIQMPTQTGTEQRGVASKSMQLSAKKEHAKKNIKEGAYNEAYKDIKDALEIEPNDAEAKAIHAKIKTLQ